MTEGDIHVVPDKGTEKWKIKKEGNEKASKICDTQAEAIEIAKAQGKKEKVEVLTHGKTGKIRDRVSYGNDPCPPKDKN